MEYTLILLSLFIQATGSVDSDLFGVKCGFPVKQQSVLQHENRIMGGEAALPGSWPWMVMLKKHGTFTCGGSILNSRYIITAAHCFKGDKNPRPWKVYVGKYHKNSTDSTEMVHTVLKIIPHEYFYYTTLNNDIALILLKEHLRFTDFVSPICLPLPNMRMERSKCFTTGWGDTKGTGNDDKLKQVRLEKVHPFKCNSFLRRFGKESLKENVYCAGYKDSDACYRDSGGPFSCKSSGQWFLKGIVSFGAYCGQPSWYGIYVDVVKYINWIQKHMTQPH